MAAVAASATQKALQRKMTDFIRQKPLTPSSGAGELPSGPCGSAAGQKSLTEEVAQVVGHLRVLQEQQQQKEATAAHLLLQTAAGTSGTGAGAGAGAGARPSSTAAATSSHQDGQEDEEGGWQTWTNRKGRRVGENAQREQAERQK